MRAELHATSLPDIVQIIRRVLGDGEATDATINDNLDMILAVGYRVTTPRAVQFRQWATTILREYLVEGFALDDRRLKDPGGPDCLDELLEHIRRATDPARASCP